MKSPEKTARTTHLIVRVFQTDATKNLRELAKWNGKGTLYPTCQGKVYDG